MRYTILKFLIPFLRYVPPPKEVENKKSLNHWIFISHGITGNADVYSHLAYILSSEGYTVCIVEHEDGSACTATDIHNKPIDCLVTQETIDSRLWTHVRGMIRKRTREFTNVIDDYLPPGCFYSVIGHSFGASTVICAIPKYRRKPQKIVVYDLWMDAVEYFCCDEYDYNLSEPYLCEDFYNAEPHDYEKVVTKVPQISVPILSVISNTFKGFQQIRIDEFFSAMKWTDRVKTIDAYNIHHLSFSDGANLLPTCICYMLGLGNETAARDVFSETISFLKQ